MIDTKHKAFVLGLYIPGIDALKCLRKFGIVCKGYDCIETVPGLNLRGDFTHLCPNPKTNEKAWVDFMISLGKFEEVKPVLLITSDTYLEALHRNSITLQKYYLFHHSFENVVERLGNKRSLVVSANQGGIPVPRTIFTDSKEVEIILEEAKSLTFPCLIRPEEGNSWTHNKGIVQLFGDKKLLKVDSFKELGISLSTVLKYDRKVFIQEIIPGPDHNLYYLVLYMDKSYKCKGYFCGQKLRITPIHFGSASYMRTVQENQLVEMSAQFLSKNKYWGPAGVEFKKDENTGDFKIVEINTRFGLWDIIGKKIGVDVFQLAYLDLTDQPTKLQHPEIKSIYWVSLSRDIGTFMEYRKEGSLNFFDWIKSYFKKLYFADIYVSEPRMMYYLYIHRVLRKIKFKLNKYV